MKSATNPVSMTLLELFKSNPQHYDYFEAIHLLIGGNSNKTSWTITQEQIIEHQTGDIIDYDEVHTPNQVKVCLPGLLGVKGVLPYYFREAMLKIQSDEDQNSLLEFINIFEEKLLFLRYRAIKQHSLPLISQSTNKAFIQALSNTNGSTHIPDYHLLQYSGLTGAASNQSTLLLTRLITHYFGIECRIKNKQIIRTPIPTQSTWKLSSANNSLRLGQGLVLGQNVYTKSYDLAIELLIKTRSEWNELRERKNLLEAVKQFITIVAHKKHQSFKIYALLQKKLLPHPICSASKPSARFGDYTILCPYINPNETISVLLS